MNTLVSIIVPCYKQAHFLNESLQSVLNQTYTHWECIIVNDGSPDNTETIAKQWCSKDDRFKYLYKENGGLSSARNAGITKSTGDFIVPLDADDILHQDYLLELVPELESDKKLVVVSCYSHFFIQNINNILNTHKPQGYNYNYLLYVNQLVATSLYRKQSWELVGGYDESMKHGFEDWDFWLSITKTGHHYKIIPKVLFYYRKAEKSMLVNTINNYFESTKEYIFKKHRELYINDFENCMTVLFHDLKTYRVSEIKYKTSLEYKIGKFITKPFRMLQNLAIKKP